MRSILLLWSKHNVQFISIAGCSGASRIVFIRCASIRSQRTNSGGLHFGLDHSLEQGRAFLYANGAFKVISVPNSFYTHANGIAPNGLITGMTLLNGAATTSGFTATCE